MPWPSDCVKGSKDVRCCTEQLSYSMKPKLLSFLFAATLVQPLFAAVSATSAAPTESDRPTLVIKKMVEPRMPARALDIGLAEGEVRVVISVDSTGTLTEWLVVGYTHPRLVEPVVDTIKRWEFEAPRWHGQPVSLQREVKINFENKGTVVSLDFAHFMEAYMAQRFPERFVFRPRTLKELDRIPTPITATRPYFAKAPVVPGAAKPAATDVTVEFYIDETGAVRMPSVLESSDPDLSASAVEAVRSWRFEPPTVKGRPVLVRAQQTFHFQP